MPSLKQRLSYLLMGQPGWENRINIIELLNERPYNLNQISKELNLSYRTIKHHIKVLSEHDLVTTSGSGDYGEVYFLSNELEENMDLFNNIKNKLIKMTSSPELFQKVIEQTHDGVIIIDGEKDVIFVNESGENITGYSKKDLIGNKLNFFLEENFLDKHLEEIPDNKEVSSIETKARKKSGENIQLRVNIDKIENNELMGYAIVFSNITERKKAENRIEKSEERYRRLFETAQDGMLIINAETGKIKDANPYIQDLIGYSKDELVGKELWEIGTFKDIVENKDRFEELVNEGYIRYEDLPLKTKNGDEAPVEFVSNTYHVGEERVVQCNIRDITGRKDSK